MHFLQALCDDYLQICLLPPNPEGRATISLWVSRVRASLIAQLVKNSPPVQETLVQFLGQEDPLEKGKATHFRVLAWRILWTQKSRTRLSGFHFDFSRVSWAWGFGGRLMVYAQHCSLNSYICLLNNLSCPSLSPFFPLLSSRFSFHSPSLGGRFLQAPWQGGARVCHQSWDFSVPEAKGSPRTIRDHFPTWKYDLCSPIFSLTPRGLERPEESLCTFLDWRLWKLLSDREVEMVWWKPQEPDPSESLQKIVPIGFLGFYFLSWLKSYNMCTLSKQIQLLTLFLPV